MVKQFVIALISLAIPVFVGAQVQDDIQNPKLVPPSPDAAALGKYGEIPVDKSTGIPIISVPLYEIKTPRFTLPVSLSYHASGMKVEEISSWIGAGWSLNAGGVITRSVVGFPDDGGYGFVTNHAQIKHAANIVWPNDIDYISYVVTKVLDTQPDNFYYNFNGHAGAFVFGDDVKPLLIPYEPIKMSFDLPSDNFSAIDEQGNHYTFSTHENVTSSIPDMSCVSSWYLTQMVSADLSDTIQFVYTTDASPTASFPYSFTQTVSNWGSSLTTSMKPMVSSNAINDYYTVRISSVLFKGGKVDFIAAGGRLDEGIMALDSVIVSNYNSSTGQYSRVKSFTLRHGYFYSTLSYPSDLSTNDADKHRLTLTGVTENDMNNLPVGTYQFTYNSGMLPQVHSYAQDYWGYFNGQIMNESLLQTQQIVITPGNNLPLYVDTIGKAALADRSISPDSMQAGVLQQITYPTRGYTVFSYECNKEEGVATAPFTTTAGAVSFQLQYDTVTFTPTGDELASGADIFHVRLRESSDNPTYPPAYVLIKQIVNGTATVVDSIPADLNHNMDTLIALSLSAITYQLIAVAQGPNNQQQAPWAVIATTYQAPTGGNLINMGGLRVKSIANYNPDGSLANMDTYRYGNNDNSGGGVQLSFSQIHKFTRETACTYNQNGATLGNATTYSSVSYYPMASLNGSSVAYPTVIVYHGDSLRNTGKTMYQYAIYPDSLQIVFGGFWDGIRPTPVTWKHGEPLSTSYYRNIGPNLYALQRNVSNNFNIVYKRQATGTIISYTPEPIVSNPNDDCSLFVGPYIYNNVVYSAGGGGGAAGVCSWLPGYFYWFDYPISSGVRTLTATTVTDYDSTGTIPLMTNTTQYFYDDTTLYLPTRTVTTDSKGLTHTLYTYRPLDQPSINAITPLSGSAVAALDTMVNRNILTPVIQQAEYVNGSLTEFSLTNYNNWSSNITAPQTVQTQMTGYPLDTRLQYNSYDGNGNPLEVQKANDMKEVYLWGYHGLYPVAKIENSTYAVASTYVTQSVLDNPSSDAALRSQLANLRNIPGALVTTFTYDPLVGMTSQTNPQGQTTYYEYDAYGRLADIKDTNGNIVKTYQYHYKGQ